MLLIYLPYDNNDDIIVVIVLASTNIVVDIYSMLFVWLSLESNPGYYLKFTQTMQGKTRFGASALYISVFKTQKLGFHKKPCFYY